jgi:triacylglycerol lipase
MNLVFASGVLIPQEILGVDYFRGLKAHVEGKGHQAIFPQVPTTETVEKRAIALANAIHAAYPTGPIHIIAHSMGGLDSRFLIGRNLNGLSEPGRIASLTTLSTPHRGSPIADLVVSPKPDDVRRRFYSIISHTLELIGVSIDAVGNLTREAAEQVPDAASTHTHIRYQSYFASGRNHHNRTCLLFAPTYQYIYLCFGLENDGFVTRQSAEYGTFQTPTWQCDHADMVGHNLDTFVLSGFQFDHFSAYDAIISSL